MLHTAVLVILFPFYFQSRKKAKKGDNLDDLKQELDIDYHKISLEELYQRFSTNPDTVSTTVQIIVYSLHFFFFLYCMTLFCDTLFLVFTWINSINIDEENAQGHTKTAWGSCLNVSRSKITIFLEIFYITTKWFVVNVKKVVIST